MKVQKIPYKLFVLTFCIAIISLTFSFHFTQAQAKPLSLAQVLTGLQSRSGGFSIAEKNTFITTQVRQKGVTFKLTPELERELRTAGASSSLIRMIRLKSGAVSPTPRSNNNSNPPPNASYDRIWVEQDILEKNVRGVRIYANFSVFNLKDIKSDIVYRFRKNGTLLKGKTTKYKTSTGHLSARRYLSPKYTTTVYEELASFIPYSEFNLSPGTHRVSMEAYVIKRDGTNVKKLTTQTINLVMPSPTLARSKGSATLTRMWIEYKVKQNGVWGMRIHVKMNVKNLNDQTAFLRILFTKQDGTPLKGKTRNFRTKSGQTAIFRRLNPKYISSNYNDISMFIPYSEFGLPVGKHNLKLHTDVVSENYQQISHLNYKPFTYTRRR